MENFIFKFFYIVALVISVLRKSSSSSSLEDSSVAKDGDIVLGALFPFYREDSNGDCTLVNKDRLLWIKALKFALDELKTSNNPWLRNVTFGLYLRDTCSKPALEHSLDILHLNKQQTTTLKRASTNKVLAVLTNSNDVESSTLLSLFRIPQILFSEQLYKNDGSFPSHQPYYFESIKTSYYRAKSLVGLIKYFQWKSVSLVVSQPFFKEYLMFQHFAEMENICLAVVLENDMLDNQDVSGDKTLLNRLGHDGFGVRVVILFAGEKDMLKMIQGVAVKKPSHYIWIDAMGTAESVTQELSRMAETILTLAPEYLFLEELKNHNVQLDCKKETFEQDGKGVPGVLVDPCDIEVSSQGILDETLEAFARKQTRDTRMRLAHRRAVEVQGIVNSVFAIGHAVSQYMQTQCWDKTKEQCFDSFGSHHLAEQLQILIQKLFQGDSIHGNTETNFFKENIFSLVHLHGNSSGSRSRVVGTWDNKEWYINRAGIIWPGKSSVTPDSTCAPTCPIGHIQVAEKGRKCCWSCQPCNYNQYITNTSTCADCVRGYWPSKDFRSCEFKLQLTILSCAGALSSVAVVLYSLVL